MGLLSTGVGLDVSDHHIRIAWVNHQGVPKGVYELVLPKGYVVDDKVEKPDAVRKQVMQLIAESSLASVNAKAVLLIPESRVFSTSFELKGKLAPDVLKAQAIRMGQSELPIPFRDAFTFIREGVHNKKSPVIRVGVLAVEKETAQVYQKAFTMPELPFAAIESGGKGIFRLFERFGIEKVQLKSEKDLVMVVDVGHRWTNITVYDKIGAEIFSRSFTLGKHSEEKGDKAHQLHSEDVQRICTNLNGALTFFKESGFRIPVVLLAGAEGGQADLQKQCKIAVKKQVILRLGEVVAVPDVSPEDVHEYGPAIGAAIRAARPGHYKKDHNFLSL